MNPARDGSHPGRWQPVASSSPEIAVADREAIGTSVRLAVWPVAGIAAARRSVDDELDTLDRQASRFRADSELVLAGTGPTVLSPGLADALRVALALALVTDGLVDPTVGVSLCALGYDRDFADVLAEEGRAEEPAPVAAQGWRRVRLDGRVLRTDPGVVLDLGSTGKGLGADRCARAALRSAGGRGGVLVSLGGDIAVAGEPPRSGWPVAVGEDPGHLGDAPVVRLVRGAVATSSTVHRRWTRGGAKLHHIVVPSTGLPAGGPWRTVTVAAHTCAEANAAATAAIVAGEGALEWLGRTGLAARLVGRTGRVELLGDWPTEPDGPLAPGPEASLLRRFSRAVAS